MEVIRRNVNRLYYKQHLLISGERTASRTNNANDQNQQTMESKMHNYKQPLYIVTARNLASGFPLCLLEACTQGPCHQRA